MIESVSAMMLDLSNNAAGSVYQIHIVQFSESASAVGTYTITSGVTSVDDINAMT